MLLAKNLQRQFSRTIANHNSSALSMSRMQTPQRQYFTFMEKVRDKINKPLRHIKSFMEPDGINYQT